MRDPLQHNVQERNEGRLYICPDMSYFIGLACGRTILQSAVFSVSTATITIEITVVTTACYWLKSKDYTNACVLNESVKIIREDMFTTWAMAEVNAKVEYSQRHAHVCGESR